MKNSGRYKRDIFVCFIENMLNFSSVPWFQGASCDFGIFGLVRPTHVSDSSGLIKWKKPRAALVLKGIEFFGSSIHWEILEFSARAFKLINESHFRFDDPSDFIKSTDLEVSATASASSDFCPHPLVAFAT